MTKTVMLTLECSLAIKRRECSFRLQRGWNSKALRETAGHEKPQGNALHLCETSQTDLEKVCELQFNSQVNEFLMPGDEGWRGERQEHVRGRNHRVLRSSCTFEQFFLWGRSASQKVSGHGSVTDTDNQSKCHTLPSLIWITDISVGSFAVTSAWLSKSLPGRVSIFLPTRQ